MNAVAVPAAGLNAAVLPPGFVPGITPLINLYNPVTGTNEPFYTPTPKQCELHFSTQRNVLYGGRAGTGKTIALRNDGHARCLTQRGYRCLLVRRQMTELRDTHLDKLSVEADAIGARYRASETTVVYTATNSRFRFGHVEDDAALKQYLSSEFDCIYFDELATFTEFQFRFLCSRLRTQKTGDKAGSIPLVRAGSNPGMMWMYDYFIAKDVDADRDPGYNPDHYQFIPATVADNPHQDPAEYNIRLNSLPTEALRKMYRDGDFDSVEGQFYEEWQASRPYEGDLIPWHVITELPYFQGKPCLLTPWIEIIRCLDWGFSEEEPGVCEWVACLPDGSAIAFQEYKFVGTTPEKLGPILREMSQFNRALHGRTGPMKIRYTVAGEDAFAHRTGESIAETLAKRKHGGIGMIVGDNSHPAGFTRVHSWLKTEFFSTRPYPAIQFLSPSSAHGWSGCPYAIRTFPSLTKDKLDPTKIGSHQPDHAADAIKYWAMSRPNPSREVKPSLLAGLPPYVRKALLKSQPRASRLGVESVRKR